MLAAGVGRGLTACDNITTACDDVHIRRMYYWYKTHVRHTLLPLIERRSVSVRSSPVTGHLPVS